MKESNSRLKGFTLMESLVVLLLLSLFLLLPILTVGRLTQRYQNNYFYHQVRRNFTRFQELCIQRRTSGSVRFNEENIQFYVGDRVDELSIAIPKEIKVTVFRGNNQVSEVRYSALGNNSGFFNIEFQDSFRDARIIYRFQLLRGKIHVEEI